MDAAPSKTLLLRLADFIEDRQTVVTEQWLNAIAADKNMEASHHLTHQQLIDHLPMIYKELCKFIRQRDAATLTGEIKQDARKHGEHRWKNGYRIEELLREINILHRIVLATFVTMFANANSDFTGNVEITARHLIGEFFNVLILNSVSQFVREQQEQVVGYTQRLEAANRQWELQNGQLAEQAASRLHLTNKAAQELRQVMQKFSESLQILQTPSTDAHSVRLLMRQAANIKMVVDQLSDYTGLLHNSHSLNVERIELKEIYAELLICNERLIEMAGHSLKKEFDESLRTALSDKKAIKQIGTNMLTYALRYAREKEIAWAFLPVDAERWMMRVIYGSKLNGDQNIDAPIKESGAVEISPAHSDDLGFATVKELAALLNGTARLISTAGIGTRFETILPYRN